jgi:hypothetical protein
MVGAGALMATFDFTAPDGKSYSVQGPDGATPEQAFQILQQHLGAPPPEPSSTFGGIAKSLGTGLAQGALGLAGLPADLAHLYAPNQSDPNPLGAQGLQKKVEQYTGDFYKPQGTLEETASRIGQFAPAMIGGPETLATKALTRVVAPAVGSEVAGKITEGTALQPYAEVAGALAGGVGASAAANKFKAMAAARQSAATIPTGEELLKTGSDQFNQARNMDLTVKPDFAKRTAQDMRAAVQDYDPEQIKPVLNAINRVEELYQPAQPNLYNALLTGKAAVPVPMNEVELARKQLSNLRLSTDPSVRSAAKAAQEVITKNQMALQAADAVTGDAPLYAKTLQEAVGNYGAGKRSSVIQGKQDLADLNAGTAGSGANVDNATRQAIKQLARPMNNTNVPVAKKLGFNDQEIAAINKVATGTALGNTARFLGKGAPTGIVSAAGGLGIGHMAGGPVGAVVLPAAAYVAKKIGDLSTKQAVSALDSLVRSRSPLAAQVSTQIKPQLINMLPAKTQRALQGLIAADRIAAQTSNPISQTAPQYSGY